LSRLETPPSNGLSRTAFEAIKVLRLGAIRKLLTKIIEAIESLDSNRPLGWATTSQPVRLIHLK
jgi:hypothetical protein